MSRALGIGVGICCHVLCAILLYVAFLAYREFMGGVILGGRESELSPVRTTAYLALIFAVLAGICGVVCLVSVAMKRPTPPSPESPGVPER
jgi:hypothetical protein